MPRYQLELSTRYSRLAGTSTELNAIFWHRMGGEVLETLHEDELFTRNAWHFPVRYQCPALGWVHAFAVVGPHPHPLTGLPEVWLYRVTRCSAASREMQLVAKLTGSELRGALRTGRMEHGYPLRSRQYRWEWKWKEDWK